MLQTVRLQKYLCRIQIPYLVLIKMTPAHWKNNCLYQLTGTFTSLAAWLIFIGIATYLSLSLAMKIKDAPEAPVRAVGIVNY